MNAYRVSGGSLAPPGCPAVPAPIVRRWMRFSRRKQQRHMILLALFCTTCLVGCAGGMSAGAPPSAPVPFVVTARAGQTVEEIIESLPASGGTVILGEGVWQMGSPSYVITQPHITIKGAGMPGYNADFSAMVRGTIIQGVLLASAGSDYLSVSNLGVDVGSAYIHGGAARDG